MGSEMCIRDSMAVGLVGASTAMIASAVVIAIASVAALCSPGVRGLRWSEPVAGESRSARLVQLDAKPEAASAGALVTS